MKFTSHGPVPPSSGGFKDSGPSPSDLAYGSPPPAKALKVPNPTYIDGIHYAEEYFQQQADVAAVIGRAAETGFEKFKVRTSEEYNRSGATASELFSLALAIAPGGAAIRGVLQAVKTAEKIKKLAEAVEKVSATAEKVHAVSEVREKKAAISESREAQSEGKERGNFEMETADNLLEMALSSVRSRWSKQHEIDELLGRIEYSEPSIDIKGVVAQALGALPDYGALETAAKRTADEFEYLLYYQYYAESGTASNIIYIKDDLLANHDPVQGEIENVPGPVLARIGELGKAADFRRGVAAFNTEYRHVGARQAKPY